MSTTRKRYTHIIILLLVLIVSLGFVFVSSGAGQKPAVAIGEAGTKTWYRLKDSTALYWGAGHNFISVVCDPYGNLIYGIEFGENYHVQVLPSGCEKESEVEVR